MAAAKPPSKDSATPLRKLERKTDARLKRLTRGPKEAVNFAVHEVKPADLLTAAETIKPYDVLTIPTRVAGWVSSDDYWKWGSQGLASGDEAGLAGALSNAKRSVCRAIDGFLFDRYLDFSSGLPYPEKLELLTRTGVGAPRAVYEYIIGPRNDEEHRYQRPELKRARDALEIAKLFLDATRSLRNEGCPVLVGDFPTFQLEWMQWLEGNERLKRLTLPIEPFIFADPRTSPTPIKVVNPRRAEVLTSRLDAYTRDEALQICSLMGHRNARPSNPFRPLTRHSLALADVVAISTKLRI